MRAMQTEDLGDPRQFEDEAIREQAARLQIHLETLLKRVDLVEVITPKTASRLIIMASVASTIRWKSENTPKRMLDDRHFM